MAGMRFAVIASGSDGNAALVDAGDGVLLVDCGLSYRRLTAGCAHLGLGPESICGVLLTHEHGDHVHGLPAFLARHRVPVLTAAETFRGLSRRRGLGELGPVEWCRLEAGRPTWHGPFEVLPLPTSHDARRPLAFRLSAKGSGSLGYVTDTGEASSDLLSGLEGCRLLALEANHCPTMLRLGPYPRRLKARISSSRGHLSNEAAADALKRLASPALEAVVGLHLSRTNNTPELAEATLREGLEEVGMAPAVSSAGRQGSAWFHL